MKPLLSITMLFVCAALLSGCMTTHDYPEAPVTQGQVSGGAKAPVWGYDPSVCVGAECTCGAGDME